jgi:hypothetical protein
MSYEKLGFTSGQTLKAEHLNHMEEGIANAGGVTSWNDLEDKPFGESSGEVVLFDGTAVDGDTLKIKSLLELGKEYIVVFDGVTYNLVAFDDDGFTTIGASYSSDFSEYDFSACNDNGEVTVFFVDSNEHSLRISTMGQVVKPIDEKYMPDSIKSFTSVVLVSIDFDTQTLSHTPAEIVAMAEQGKTVLFGTTGTAFNTRLVNGVLYAVSVAVGIDDDGVVARAFIFDQHGKLAATDDYSLSATKK